MEKDNIILKKTYQFALKMIEFVRFLNEKKVGKQILRSGTSIGANVEESIGGQSEKDFLSKFSIAYKEARETHYWLRLIRDSNITETKTIDPLLNSCEDIIKIIGKIQSTLRKKLKINNC